MASIDYSQDASNILDKFYRCDALVYVEGDDDVPFWSIAFKVFAGANVEVQAVNGSVELDKWIDRIVEEDLRIVAARDSDFIMLAVQAVLDESVVYTYGYSIENSLYHVVSLSEMSSVMCRKYRADVVGCKQWLTDFFDKLKILISCDVAYHVFNKGESVVSDNCTRFMESEKSSLLDQKKLDAKISEIKSKMGVEEIEYAQNLINTHGVDFHFHLKGHFLASAAQKYLSTNVKEFGKGNSVSFEAMYAAAIEYIRGNFPHIPGADFYRAQIECAMRKINSI